MFFHESIHYKDATTQVASNHGNLQILERGAKKWEIAKTIIRTTHNGFIYPCYVDKYNRCVYYEGAWMFCTDISDIPLIGEVENTEEGIMVYHESWNKGENDDEESN